MNRNRIQRQNQRDRDRLERNQRARLNSIVSEAQDEARRAFVRGDFARVIAVSTGILSQIGDVLVEGSVAAHLLGWRRTWLATRSQIALSHELSVYDEATRFARQRMKLSPTQLDALRLLYATPAVEMVNGINETLEARLRGTLARIVESGVHVRGGTAILRKMAPELLTDFQAAGLTRANPYLYQTIYRSQVNLAYMAGRMNANADSAVDEVLWGYEYVTAEDDRVRPNHEALHGLRLEKNNPRWAKIMPPNGYNCRCDVIEIFREEKEAARHEPASALQGGADAGWQFNPGSVFKDTLSRM